jgi:hypothetical protein
MHGTMGDSVSGLTFHVSRITHHASRFTHHASTAQARSQE